MPTMESTTDILNDFLSRIIDDIVKDAESKKIKAPVASLRSVVEMDGATGSNAALYAADYFKYLIHGRGPGKFPPPDKMLSWVQGNPDVLERAKQVYKYLTESQLAFLIGRKISQSGTDIFQGKRPGIDLLGIMEKNTPELLRTLAKNEAIKIGTSLKSSLK